jgi:ditrans,polycis-polyprenyl diphosphate synthase
VGTDGIIHGVCSKRITDFQPRATLNICAPYTSRDEITTAIRNTVLDFTKPQRPILKRPFSETHIARNIRARQLSTVNEGEESNGADKMNDSDNTAEEDAVAAYNRIDNIVERYLENLDPDQSFDAPTDAVLDILRDHSLSEDEKRSAVDRTLNSPISNTDYADLKALTALLDPTASQNSSTLNLSTTDPTTNTLVPPNTNFPDPETITEDTITAHTFTGTDSPPLDLLIRTSGVERLSDFMLWQCHQETEIVFLKCMWPEFDLWHFMPVLLEWQWQRRKGLPLEYQELRKKM